jgi:putative nucleotidyltransferase with HDIG domain
MQLITEIAMAVSVRGRMFANKQCAELLGMLWKHSVLAGFYTKEIARLRRRNVEIAFLCGLLHDVGRAVLVNNCDRVLGKQEIALPLQLLIDAVEEQHLAAGALLAKEWKLPDQVAEAVACHHDPAAAKHFADMAMTVQLADLLAYAILPGPLAPPMTVEQLGKHPVLVGLNIYPDQFAALWQMRERAVLVAEGMA